VKRAGETLVIMRGRVDKMPQRFAPRLFSWTVTFSPLVFPDAGTGFRHVFSQIKNALQVP
jgi:hypothetical protein